MSPAYIKELLLYNCISMFDKSFWSDCAIYNIIGNTNNLRKNISIHISNHHNWIFPRSPIEIMEIVRKFYKMETRKNLVEGIAREASWNEITTKDSNQNCNHVNLNWDSLSFVIPLYLSGSIKMIYNDVPRYYAYFSISQFV